MCLCSIIRFKHNETCSNFQLNIHTNSFRSYSSTRNHQRRSPTTVSSMRSSSYHSPTRCNSPISSAQQQANVLSRPSSPASTSSHSSRHSAYSDRERSSSVHHPTSNRTSSHASQVTGVEGHGSGSNNEVVSRELRERRESRNERSSTVQTSCVPGSPGANSATVHQRANSGPTIAISMFHDPEANNG